MINQKLSRCIYETEHCIDLTFNELSVTDTTNIFMEIQYKEQARIYGT